MTAIALRTCLDCAIPLPAAYPAPTCLFCRNEAALTYPVLAAKLATRYGHPLPDPAPTFHAAPWAATLAAPAPAAPTFPVRDGRYTVVHTDGSHHTFQLSTSDDGTVQFVGLLTGPDNTRNYRPFCHYRDGSVRLNRAQAHMANTPAHHAALGLYLATPDAQVAAGIAYALPAKRCWICYITLTTPESLHAGYGPTCAKNYGLPWGAVPPIPAPPAAPHTTDLDPLNAVQRDVLATVEAAVGPISRKAKRAPRPRQTAAAKAERLLPPATRLAALNERLAVTDATLLGVLRLHAN